MNSLHQVMPERMKRKSSHRQWRSIDVTFCDVMLQESQQTKNVTNSQECEVQTGNHLSLKLLSEIRDERFRTTERNI